VEFYGIGTTEKSPFCVDVTARGTGRPRLASDPTIPCHRLIRALNRIAGVADAAHGDAGRERSFRDLATIERDSTFCAAG